MIGLSSAPTPNPSLTPQAVIPNQSNHNQGAQDAIPTGGVSERRNLTGYNPTHVGIPTDVSRQLGAPASAPPGNKGGGGAGAGKTSIIAVAGGCVAMVILVIALVVLWVNRRRRKRVVARPRTPQGDNKADVMRRPFPPLVAAAPASAATVDPPVDSSLSSNQGHMQEQEISRPLSSDCPKSTQITVGLSSASVPGSEATAPGVGELCRMVQSHEDATLTLNARVLDLEQAVPGPDAGASSSAPSRRQLEERVDHVVAMLGDINTFAAPTTISSQLHTLKTEVQQLQSTNTDGNPKLYKMPTFQLEKFDDYTQQDPVLWWEAFTTQLMILPIAKHAYIGALFMNSKGGCQTWLTHLATSHGVDVPDLKDKMTWEELTRLWKKRFIVDDAPTLAINRLFTMSQGNTATRDWLTEWQKIVAVPNLDLPFTHLRREFYNRSCAALSHALGEREQYTTFTEIIDKAREIIKTNRSTAHEKSTWQPTYAEKVRTGPRPQHFAAVQSDSGEDPTATPASRDGDQVSAVQPRSNNKARNNGKAKPTSQAGNGQPAPPWVKFSLTEAEYKYHGRYGCCY
ncbi:hypothetical protein CBR_g24396 [Chara braunii]|uniref:Retrotransposon gag domain-containing protein n=1 Tax=Chara braunii TaxID=69332 RepID=A0A388JMJ0_CHABU|nr:hypothetical protein CBR_g24396 [Chara braunii]|eukprot:GBG59050.1 hypothetical protein CBR_g24396 [Chara braunii]